MWKNYILIFFFSQKMCVLYNNLSNSSSCPNGDACPFSHNIYEQMFYPTNYQSVVCPTEAGKECLQQPFYKFAHRGKFSFIYLIYLFLFVSFKAIFIGLIIQYVPLFKHSGFNIKIYLYSLIIIALI